MLVSHKCLIKLARQVDGCYAEPSEYAKTYPLLGKAVNETGRPIVYSCSWPAYLPDPVQTQFQVRRSYAPSPA